MFFGVWIVFSHLAFARMVGGYIVFMAFKLKVIDLGLTIPSLFLCAIRVLPCTRGSFSSFF
ncbi:hypothetical protein HanRHA438_Chr03g0122911 [Helianthus annuus]|nr:hypothetical protein HanRHA438_Chr03g0122911 [Helianthus annuus]